MDRLDQLFTQFLRERVYLHNITPKTREFYETAWKAFMRSRAAAPPREPSLPVITRTDLQEFVVHLRERGVKPVSCNCWMRGLNAFCRWLHQQGEIPQPLRLPPQRLEKKIVPTHSSEALRAILRFRPKSFAHWRVHVAASTLVDTGCRIDELLTARVSDFDLDNLLLTVVGKGRKQRKVPFSIELRKLLFRFGQIKDRGDSIRGDVPGSRPAMRFSLWRSLVERRSLPVSPCSGRLGDVMAGDFDVTAAIDSNILTYLLQAGSGACPRC
jgi:integrase/recombinase XerD